MTEDLELHVGLSGEKAFAASVAQMTAAVARMEATIAKMPQATAPAAKGIDSVGSAAKSSGGMLSSFGGIVGGIATAAFGALVTGAAKSAIAYETLSVQMAVLLKDAAKVPAVLNEWKKFSDLTPMEPEQVNRGGKQLLAFGVAVDDVIPKMRVLGDIASGSGKDFNELIAIYGKAKAAGKVQGDILSQLVDGSINILPELAKIMNVSQGEVAKLGEQSKISFEIFDQALQNMVATGSLYGGMMDKMSQSTEGLISSLKGELDGALREIGMAMLPFINDLVRAAIPAIQQAIPYIKAFGQGILEAKDALMGYVSDLIEPLRIMVTSTLKAFGLLADGADVTMSFGDAIKGLIKFLEPAQKMAIGFATAVGKVIEQVAGYIAQDPLFQAAFSAISAIAETVVGWFDAIANSAPWAIDALETVVAVIYRMVNPLQLIWDLWGAIFGDGEESIGGLAESTKTKLGEFSTYLQTSFSATSAQVTAFAQSFDMATLKGLSHADALYEIKKAFGNFLAGAQDCTDGVKGLGEEAEKSGKKIVFTAGSIDALNAQLSKLKAAFEATGSEKTRLDLAPQIESIEKAIDRASHLTEIMKSVATGLTAPKAEDFTNAELDEYLGTVTDATIEATRHAEHLEQVFSSIGPSGAKSLTELGNAAESAGVRMRKALTDALGEGAAGAIFEGLESLKGAFMDFGVSAATSIGYAIGAGASLKEAFMQSLRELLVEVPRLTGMALLNAAAYGGPAALPLAAAGLALLGLSGILKGVQDKNAEERKKAIEGIPTSASGGGASPGSATGGFAGLTDAIQEQPVNVNVSLEMDGVAMGGLIHRVTTTYNKERIR